MSCLSRYYRIRKLPRLYIHVTTWAVTAQAAARSWVRVPVKARVFLCFPVLCRCWARDELMPRASSPTNNEMTQVQACLMPHRQLALLLRIWELPNSNLSPDIGYPDRGVSWFSSVPPYKCRDCVNRVTTVSFHTLTNSPIVLARYTGWATVSVGK
jgi:hypothetical protein